MEIIAHIDEINEDGALKRICQKKLKSIPILFEKIDINIGYSSKSLEVIETIFFDEKTCDIDFSFQQTLREFNSSNDLKYYLIGYLSNYQSKEVIVIDSQQPSKVSICSIPQVNDLIKIKDKFVKCKSIKLDTYKNGSHLSIPIIQIF